ncbi:MAG: hypothetical protein ACXW4L_06090 [Candidatus Limnocylindrales bacterium]
MLTTAVRFFLLRFLPRRLLPILTAIEVFRLVQRLRRRSPAPVAPRRLVTATGPDRVDTTAT